MPARDVAAIGNEITLLNAQVTPLSSSILSSLSTSLLPVAATASNTGALVTTTIEAGVASPTGLVDDIVNAIKQWIADRLRELGDAIGGWIGSIASRIGEFISDIFSGIGGWINQIVTTVRDAISNVASAIRATITSLVTALTNSIESLFSRIGGIISEIRTGISNLVNQIGSVVSNLVNTLRVGLENLVGGIRNLVSEIANVIGRAVGDAVRQVGEFIGGIVNAVRAGFEQVAGNVLSAIGNLVNGIRDRVAELVNTVLTVAGNIVTGVRQGIEAAFEAIRSTGERVIIGIRDFIANLIASILTFIQDVVHRATVAAQQLLGIVNETVAQPFFRFTRELQVSIASKALVAAQALRGGYGDAGALLQALFSPVAGISPAANASGWILSAAFAAGTAPLVAGDAFEALRQNLRASLSVNKVDPGTAVGAVIKGGIARDTAARVASAYGLSGEQLNIMFEAARQVMVVGEVLEATNRGLMSEEGAMMRLQHQGYRSEDAAILLGLRFQIPGVQDLIRFMVRDAFNEAIVERYGYDEDFPEAVLQWTRKQGLSDEFTQAYWRAHWELPSPTQGFEMLHRGVIDMPDLLTLLKIEDYPPFWREKLAAISYNPIGRIDIRRMYRIGVLDRDAVEKRYQMIGYTPEDSKLLAEFTVKYEHTELENTLDRLETRNEKAVEVAYSRGRINRETAKQLLIRLRYTDDVAEQILALVDFEREVLAAPDDTPEFRQLSASLIRQAYTDRVLDRDAALSHLMTIGYSEADSRFLLSLEDFGYQREIRNAQADIAVTRYVEDIIDERQLVIDLGMLQMSEEQIGVIVERANLARRRKVKRLTEATLARLLRLDIITDGDYRAELHGLGYSDLHIDWLSRSRIVPT